MHSNIGRLDRIVRFVAGSLILGTALFSGLPILLSPIAFWAAIAVGALLVMTSVAKICPAYIPFNISTLRMDR
ncbi:MAG: YgaP family membrane protein [Devosia sp.]